MKKGDILKTFSVKKPQPIVLHFSKQNISFEIAPKDFILSHVSMKKRFPLLAKYLVGLGVWKLDHPILSFTANFQVSHDALSTALHQRVDLRCIMGLVVWSLPWPIQENEKGNYSYNRATV